MRGSPAAAAGPLLLALLAASAPRAANAQSDPPDPRVERARAAATSALQVRPLRPRDIRRAERALVRWIALAPSDSRIAVAASLRLPDTAEDAARMDEPEAAESSRWVLGLLSALTPADRAPVERLRAWAYAVRGDEDEALALLARYAGVHDEPSAMALRRLAALALRRERHPLAEQALQVALRAYAEEPALVGELAAFAIARGEPDRAVRLLQRELRHRPDDRSLREDLAGALLAAGAAEAAYRQWRTLADGASLRDASRLHRATARAALSLERFELGRVGARRALGVAPDDGEARLLLGLSLVGLGAPGAARVELRRARETLGDDLRVERALRALEPAGETGGGGGR